MWKKNWLTCWNSNLSHSRNTDQYGHLVLKICFLNFFFVVVPESCVHVGNKCLFHPNPQPLWVGDLNLKRYNHLLLRKRITLSSHNAWYPLTLFASFVCSILQIIFHLLVFPFFFFLNSVVTIVFSSELNYGYSAGPLNAWFFLKRLLPAVLMYIAICIASGGHTKFKTGWYSAFSQTLNHLHELLNECSINGNL